MLESSLVYIIARTFPESIVAVLSGMILLGINIDKGKVLKYGIYLGFIISIIRLLPINFGVHSILSMIAVWMILFKNSSNDISEGIYILIATDILNIGVEKLMDNTSLNGAIITLPSLLIMFLIVILIKYIKCNILKFNIRD